ncbi:MAG: branched-chain amino acid ABC transporter permease [Actinobacteria bacterium]|nr:branched-chain amino acid ABC transporter permease [Actinomycetota bacterium]
MLSGSKEAIGRFVKWGTLLLLVCLALAYPWLFPNPYLRFVGVMTVMYMGLATSWNLMAGNTGYVSLGHSAFFGVGAYFTGIMIVRFDMPPFAMVAAAGVFVGLFAIVIGWLALRTRDASFVIVTLALVYIMLLLAQGWRGLTGGSSGLSLPRMEGIGREDAHVPFYFAFLILLAVVLFTTWWIGRSKFGMGLVAIRGDEDKAAALGVNTDLYKLIAFVLSAGFTGIGGGIYVYWFSYIEPFFVFSITIGVNMILMALLGGTRSLFGPALGALLLVPGTQYLIGEYGSTQLHVVLTGLLLGAIVMVLPMGIIPSLRSAAAHLWSASSGASSAATCTESDEVAEGVGR